MLEAVFVPKRKRAWKGYQQGQLCLVICIPDHFGHGDHPCHVLDSHNSLQVGLHCTIPGLPWGLGGELCIRLICVSLQGCTGTSSASKAFCTALWEICPLCTWCGGERRAGSLHLAVPVQLWRQQVYDLCSSQHIPGIHQKTR